MKDTIKLGLNFKGMVAHRGAALINTENTLKAFEFSSKRTYVGLECDVHPTKDDKIVISHDSNLRRVSNVDAYIPNYTYEELKQIKFIDINTGEVSDELYAPLLSDYLKVCKENNKVAVIELKETLREKDLYEIKRIVEEEGMIDNVVFISFFPGYLTKLRSLLPNTEMQFLTQIYTDSILDLCVQFNLGIDAYYPIMTKEIIDKYHKHNLKVNVYTVNELEVAQKLVSYGIDYITSNIIE
ncbi:MAG: hypothetical protein K6G38_05470 [Gammaproteobacteria bacterium]|nr:hypothetical protein [Gammaproteobacteria bacterium]